MRKGQLHPTVVLSAMKSLLSSTSTGIGPQDVSIQVCGGTPEASVAAILAGFSHVLYVGSPQEQKWMKLPSESEESMYKIDYSAYNSPNVELPDEGILVAEAVLMLAPFIRNYVFETANAIKIAPPNQIRIPPLRTYTFIAITGRVVARTVLPEQHDEDEQPTKKTKTGSSPSGPTSSPGGPGSASGAVPFKTPPKKGKVTADDAVEEDNGEEEDAVAEDGAEGGEECDNEDELAQLEALEASSNGNKQLGRGRPKAESKKVSKNNLKK